MKNESLRRQKAVAKAMAQRGAVQAIRHEEACQEFNANLGWDEFCEELMNAMHTFGDVPPDKRDAVSAEAQQLKAYFLAGYSVYVEKKKSDHGSQHD
jgi:hypothetical protein